MIWRYAVSYLKSFCVGFGCTIPIYITLTDTCFCLARVDGISMQPTLNPGINTSDIVLLDKWNVRDVNSIKPGDIVSLFSPRDPDVKFVKRVVATPGQVVSPLHTSDAKILIPSGHCWVEGDNHNHSLDSNKFGPISLGLITGRAAFVVWPPRRWCKLDNNIPQKRLTLMKLDEAELLNSLTIEDDDIF